MTDLTPDLLEKFVLAENKTDLLKEVTPHSNLFNFLELFILLNNPKTPTAELDEKFLNFKKHSPKRQDLELIDLKLLFRKLEESKNSPEKTKKIASELNRKYLNQQFNYSNPSKSEFRNDLRDNSTNVPLSKLTPDQLNSMKLQTYLENVYKNPHSTSLKREYLTQLDLSRFHLKNDFDKIVERILLAHDDISNIKGIENVIKEICTFKGQNYVRNNLWGKMTLKLKTKLMEPNEALFSSKELFMDFLDEKFELTKFLNGFEKIDSKITVLKSVIGFLEKVPPKYKPIRRGFIQQLLIVQEQQGIVDKKLLLSYLQDPFVIDYSWMKEEVFKKIQKTRSENPEENFSSYTNYFRPSDSQLIQKCLKRLFLTETSFSDFQGFMDSAKLQRLFWQVKLQNGQVCPNAKDYFTETELNDFFTQRELKFTENNKLRFKEGEKVEVNLSIKNISKLKVRIFEVNTLNYVLEKGNQDYELIDVSGLIPSGEFEHSYSQNPIVIHQEKFEFKNIESCRNGVFIVDFIGEEFKTRCTLYRGQLNLIYNPIHGRTCHISDQNGRICRGVGTGLYIGDTFFQSDPKTGVISIPVNIGAVDKNVVTVHDGFADMCRLKTSDPNPSFSSTVVFNSEEFVAGNKVTFAIEPLLTMYGRPASLSFVSKFSVSISTVNDQGVVNVTDFKDLRPFNDKDVLVDLIFPPKVTQITLNVDAEVKIGETISNQSQQHPIVIHRKLNNEIHDLFFRKNENGSLWVYVLGKNGEPRKNMPVNFQIKVNHSDDLHSFSLISDVRGSCEIGAIENLASIEARSDPAHAIFFEPSKKTSKYQKSVLLVETEVLELPIDSENAKFSLYSLNSKSQIKEDLTRSACTVSNNSLSIKELKEGVYVLKIDQNDIQITVVRETLKSESKHLIWIENEIYSRSEKQSLWFTQRRENEHFYEFSVKSHRPNLRCRLLTYNYLPNEMIRYHSESHRILNTHDSFELNFDRFPMKSFQNGFGDQKRMNDELMYVYDRREKTTFMGNTLEKPGVILKRTKVGTTTESEEKIHSGDKESLMAKKEMEVVRSMNKASARACSSRIGGRELAFHDSIRVNEFLGKPGKLCSDIEIVDGLLRVPKSLVSGYPFSFVWISDGVYNSILPVDCKDEPTPLKDCTLNESRKEGYIYAYNREITYLKPEETKWIPNIGNTQIFMITSLKDLFGCYETVCKNKAIDFKEWDFLHSWTNFSPMEKLKKYDKFASHEFNLFLYFKDREFFEEVVKPFVGNKKEKGVVDYFLLDQTEKCKHLFNVSVVNRVNLIEKILLAVLAKKSNPEFSQSVLNLFKNKSAVNKINKKEYEGLFEALLNANSKSITMLDLDENHRRDSEKMELCSRAAPKMQMSKMIRLGDNRCDEMERKCEKKKVSKEKDMARSRRCMDTREDKEEEMCDESEEMIYDQKKVVFSKPQGTIEYKERQYYLDKFETEINDFWTDALSHLLTTDSHRNFGSKHFLKSASTLPELLFVLSLTDLSFDKPKCTSAVSNDTLTLTAERSIILLSKEIVERKGERASVEVLCSQKLFDPEDPVIYDDEDPEVFFDKPVDEYLTNRVYALRVVITNSTTTRLKLSLVLEIPAGSIPTDSLDSLHIKDLTIDQFRSEVVQVKFYFPKPGAYSLFPATVVSNGKIVSSARKMEDLDVKTEKTSKTLKTMSDVLGSGSIDDVVEFIRSKNLLNRNVFVFPQVYWLLPNKAFYERLVLICEEKGVYDHVLWSFSIEHGDYRRLQQFLQGYSVDNLASSVKYLSSGGFERDSFLVREYYPLINPRAHVLGSAKTNILNNTFKTTYNEYLNYLFQKNDLSSEDWVLLVNYLIAQDQIEKALVLSKRVNPTITNLETRIQHDYQTAYLNFITGFPHFETAKAISQKYLTYPVLSVRNLFVEIVNQLSEFEESGLLIHSEIQKEGELLNKSKSSLVSSFSSSLEQSQVKLVSSKIGSLIVKFYKIEAEVIFSLNPFNFESKNSFSHVSPFYEKNIKINDDNDVTVTHFEIPENLREENLVIEIRSLNENVKKSEFLSYVPFRLNCVVNREMGILKCFDQKSNRPVPKVYVKCFAKLSGAVTFYKDGYTDLRGSFDYVSLNSDKIDNIESFAILVTSPEYGSKVFIETPPKKIGVDEGQAKTLISKDWENFRQKMLAENESEVNTKLKKYAHVF